MTESNSKMSAENPRKQESSFYNMKQFMTTGIPFPCVPPMPMGQYLPMWSMGNHPLMGVPPFMGVDSSLPQPMPAFGAANFGMPSTCIDHTSKADSSLADISKEKTDTLTTSSRENIDNHDELEYTNENSKRKPQETHELSKISHGRSDIKNLNASMFGFPNPALFVPYGGFFGYVPYYPYPTSVINSRNGAGEEKDHGVSINAVGKCPVNFNNDDTSAEMDVARILINDMPVFSGTMKSTEREIGVRDPSAVSSDGSSYGSCDGEDDSNLESCGANDDQLTEEERTSAHGSLVPNEQQANKSQETTMYGTKTKEMKEFPVKIETNSDSIINYSNCGKEIIQKGKSTLERPECEEVDLECDENSLLSENTSIGEQYIKQEIGQDLLSSVDFKRQQSEQKESVCEAMRVDHKNRQPWKEVTLVSSSAKACLVEQSNATSVIQSNKNLNAFKVHSDYSVTELKCRTQVLAAPERSHFTHEVQNGGLTSVQPKSEVVTITSGSQNAYASSGQELGLHTIYTSSPVLTKGAEYSSSSTQPPCDIYTSTNLSSGIETTKESRTGLQPCHRPGDMPSSVIVPVASASLNAVDITSGNQIPNIQSNDKMSVFQEGKFQEGGSLFQEDRPVLQGEEDDNGDSLMTTDQSITDESDVKLAFKCEVCLQLFRSPLGLQKHLELHTHDGHQHTCPVCFLRLDNAVALEVHLGTHSKKRPYKCINCPKAFRDPGSLQKHVRVHTGEKPFKCVNCTRSFAEYSSLRKHQRVHTGEQPYRCQFCEKAFSISGNLQRHILIHTGERPYKCNFCPKAFNNPSHLRRHVNNLHFKAGDAEVDDAIISHFGNPNGSSPKPKEEACGEDETNSDPIELDMKTNMEVPDIHMEVSHEEVVGEL